LDQTVLELMVEVKYNCACLHESMHKVGGGKLDCVDFLSTVICRASKELDVLALCQVGTYWTVHRWVACWLSAWACLRCWPVARCWASCWSVACLARNGLWHAAAVCQKLKCTLHSSWTPRPDRILLLQLITLTSISLFGKINIFLFQVSNTPNNVCFDRLDELFAMVYSTYLFESALQQKKFEFLFMPTFTMLYMHYILFFDVHFEQFLQNNYGAPKLMKLVR
jgi:hypothetical protein